MIEYIEKDITTVEFGVIAHGVNCQHTMASGVAKYIRDKWPQVYDQYMDKPKGKQMLGDCDVIIIHDCLYIANCYTQLFYGYGGGRYADPVAIRQSLVRPFQYCFNYELPLYLPRIGCARGGLSWHEDVYPAIAELHDKFDPNGDVIEVFICDYTPSDENFTVKY